MKKIAFIIAFTVLPFCISLSAMADSYTENQATGIITATGTGYGNPNAPDPYASAEQAARDVVLGLLLEATQGVYVDRETKVSDIGEKNETIKKRIEGMVRGIRSFSEPKYKKTEKGLIEATVQATMCLHNVGCKECRGQESVKKIIDQYLPPPPPTKLKAPSCEPNLQEFAGKSFKGYSTLVILMDGVSNFVPALHLYPLMVYYSDGSSGTCGFVTKGTLNADVLHEQTNNKEGRIFESAADAKSQSPQEVLEVKAVKVDQDGTIYLNEQDGKFVHFIDKTNGGIFSEHGSVKVVAKNASKTVQK